MMRLADRVFQLRLEEVSRERGVHQREIMQGRRRRGEIGGARHDLMWRLKQDGYSLPEIGRVLGLDHTSVLNGVRAHERRLAAQ